MPPSSQDETALFQKGVFWKIAAKLKMIACLLQILLSRHFQFMAVVLLYFWGSFQNLPTRQRQKLCKITSKPNSKKWVGSNKIISDGMMTLPKGMKTWWRCPWHAFLRNEMWGLRIELPLHFYVCTVANFVPATTSSYLMLKVDRVKNVMIKTPGAGIYNVSFSLAHN